MVGRTQEAGCSGAGSAADLAAYATAVDTAGLAAHDAPSRDSELLEAWMLHKRNDPLIWITGSSCGDLILSSSEADSVAIDGYLLALDHAAVDPDNMNRQRAG